VTRQVLAALAGIALAAGAPPARAASPLVYVALGDSTGVGVGADAGGGYPARIARRLEQGGMAVKLVNLSVPGATAADLRKEQVPKVSAAKPGFVTVGIGINDLVKGRSLSEYARDLEILADQLGRLKVPVVVSTLPDLALAPSAKDAPSSFSRRLAQFNAAITMIAERHGFAVADVYDVSHREFKRRAAELFAADQFHPSAKGYEQWATAMWPTVERALGRQVQGRRPSSTQPGGVR
jgi:lysophospholipase L1-like esterase